MVQINRVLNNINTYNSTTFKAASKSTGKKYNSKAESNTDNKKRNIMAGLVLSGALVATALMIMKKRGVFNNLKPPLQKVAGTGKLKQGKPLVSNVRQKNKSPKSHNNHLKSVNSFKPEPIDNRKLLFKYNEGGLASTLEYLKKENTQSLVYKIPERTTFYIQMPSNNSVSKDAPLRLGLVNKDSKTIARASLDKKGILGFCAPIDTHSSKEKLNLLLSASNNVLAKAKEAGIKMPYKEIEECLLKLL